MDFDSLVVGAGPAGLSAALLLGRARRSALVLDSGKPRNHAAHAMHGVLGHDGLDPAALRAKGVEEVGRYGIEVRPAEIGSASVIDGGVEVDGITARTLILATGMLDATPDIEGFDAIYGTSPHTCPYCDGGDHADGGLGAACAAAAAEHMGPLLRQWPSDVTVFTPAVGGDTGGPAVREPIARFISTDGQLTAVELAGGERIERDALF